ncbi:MAG: lysophospholipid acyltransferase family protein [Verrucomicrobiales bacterium]|nr:lysophospholipid acyltransferase family protein [Verrucomicrobiales bacterium]
MIVSQPPTREAPLRSKNVVIPRKLKWHGECLAWLIHWVIRGLGLTLRVRFEAAPEVTERVLKGPVIFAIWHNRLSLALPAYGWTIRKHRPHRRMAAIVSASRDGALVARVLELFEVQPVRGSSSRRGSQALLELVTQAERGLDLAVTPDGPRGPAYRVQEGVIAMAQLTGFPVIPCSYVLDTKIQLKTWDRFQIPIPFTSVRVRMGEPVEVPRDLPAAEREGFRQLLEQRMAALAGD